MVELDPKYGRFIERAVNNPFPHAQNFVKKIVFDPCGAPWWVYVETFIPAYLELAIILITMDMEDILRMEGEALASIKTTGRGYTHSIRRTVPIQETKPQRFSRLGLKTILRVTQPIEVVGFAFLLYYATDQFFYRWQTLLEQSPECGGPPGSFQAERTGGTVGVLPGGAATPLPDLIQDRGITAIGTTGAAVPQGRYFASFQIRVKGPPGGISGVRARLQMVGSIPFGTIESEAIDISEGEWADLIVNTDFVNYGIGGGSVAWEIAGPAVPVGIECETGNVVIGRTGGVLFTSA